MPNTLTSKCPWISARLASFTSGCWREMPAFGMTMSRRSMPCFPVSSLTALKASLSTEASYLTTIRVLLSHFGSSVRDRELGCVGSRLAAMTVYCTSLSSTSISKVKVGSFTWFGCTRNLSTSPLPNPRFPPVMSTNVWHIVGEMGRATIHWLGVRRLAMWLQRRVEEHLSHYSNCNLLYLYLRPGNCGVEPYVVSFGNKGS